MEPIFIVFIYFKFINQIQQIEIKIYKQNE